MKEQKFSIFIPIELEKSTKTGEDRYNDMKFRGIASTMVKGRDKEDQLIDPSGMDLDEFLTAGLINYHHKWKDKPTAIIGEPTTAKITKSNELYVEGKLYKSSQLARDVYDLAEIMEKDSSGRRMGFSIEGIPTQYDPLDKNFIKKSRITHLAITPSPICRGTKMEIMKGGIDEVKYETQKDSEYLVDLIGEDGIRYRVSSNLEIIKGEGVQASATAAESSGVTQVEHVDNSGDPRKKRKKKLEDDNKKFFTKGELLTDLISIYNMDVESCKRFWDLAVAIQKSID